LISLLLSFFPSPHHSIIPFLITASTPDILS
jgi:hypothetical protein